MKNFQIVFIQCSLSYQRLTTGQLAKSVRGDSLAWNHHIQPGTSGGKVHVLVGDNGVDVRTSQIIYRLHHLPMADMEVETADHGKNVL